MASKPTFEHRHYVKLAAIIADMDGQSWTREQIAERFASDLCGTNPNYSRERFASAAKGEPSNGRDKVR